MYGTFLYEGCDVKISSKGNKYANIYLKEIKDGTIDFKQIQARSFSKDVVDKLSMMSAGTKVSIDFGCKDIFVNALADVK